MSAVWWKGSRFDARTVDMLEEAERLSKLDLTPSQGSYSDADASAGTHSGGGAWDGCIGYSTSQTDSAVLALRKVGFAAWRRTTAQGFTPHAHAIAVQPGGVLDRGVLSGAAHDQVYDYIVRGTNGLASQSPDDGPRGPWVGITFEDYQRQQSSAWLIEGVVPMSANTVVFFQYDGVQFEANMLAGTYQAYSSGSKLQARKDELKRQGIPFTALQGDVDTPAAFGRRVGSV